MGQCNQFLAKYFITRISLFFFLKCGNKIAILSRWWTEHYCLELLRLHDVLHIFFFHVYVIVKELEMTNCELSRLMSSFFFLSKSRRYTKQRHHFGLSCGHSLRAKYLISLKVVPIYLFPSKEGFYKKIVSCQK